MTGLLECTRLSGRGNMTRVPWWAAAGVIGLWVSSGVAMMTASTFPDAEAPANWTMVGLCARESALEGGERIAIPRY